MQFPTSVDDGADGDSDAGTQVIFSLSVTSDAPIAAFAGLPGRERAPRDGDDHFYDLGRASFDESRWDARADRLDEVVNAALDRLDATGVDPSELAREGVLVRAFFTFDPGAETISAEVVQRLARIRATIWIDANAS